MPKPGIEPGTFSLRMNCTTDYAIPASTMPAKQGAASQLSCNTAAGDPTGAAGSAAAPPPPKGESVHRQKPRTDSSTGSWGGENVPAPWRPASQQKPVRASCADKKASAAAAPAGRCPPAGAKSVRTATMSRKIETLPNLPAMPAMQRVMAPPSPASSPPSQPRTNPLRFRPMVDVETPTSASPVHLRLGTGAASASSAESEVRKIVNASQRKRWMNHVLVVHLVLFWVLAATVIYGLIKLNSNISAQSVSASTVTAGQITVNSGTNQNAVFSSNSGSAAVNVQAPQGKVSSIFLTSGTSTYALSASDSHVSMAANGLTFFSVDKTGQQTSVTGSLFSTSVQSQSLYLGSAAGSGVVLSNSALLAPRSASTVSLLYNTSSFVVSSGGVSVVSVDTQNVTISPPPGGYVNIFGLVMQYGKQIVVESLSLSSVLIQNSNGDTLTLSSTGDLHLNSSTNRIVLDSSVFVSPSQNFTTAVVRSPTGTNLTLGSAAGTLLLDTSTTQMQFESPSATVTFASLLRVAGAVGSNGQGAGLVNTGNGLSGLPGGSIQLQGGQGGQGGSSGLIFGTGGSGGTGGSVVISAAPGGSKAAIDQSFTAVDGADGRVIVRPLGAGMSAEVLLQPVSAANKARISYNDAAWTWADMQSWVLSSPNVSQGILTADLASGHVAFPAGYVAVGPGILFNASTLSVRLPGSDSDGSSAIPTVNIGNFSLVASLGVGPLMLFSTALPAGSNKYLAMDSLTGDVSLYQSALHSISSSTVSGSGNSSAVSVSSSVLLGNVLNMSTNGSVRIGASSAGMWATDSAGWFGVPSLASYVEADAVRGDLSLFSSRQLTLAAAQGIQVASTMSFGLVQMNPSASSISSSSLVLNFMNGSISAPILQAAGSSNLLLRAGASGGVSIDSSASIGGAWLAGQAGPQGALNPLLVNFTGATISTSTGNLTLSASSTLLVAGRNVMQVGPMLVLDGNTNVIRGSSALVDLSAGTIAASGSLSLNATGAVIVGSAQGDIILSSPTQISLQSRAQKVVGVNLTVDFNASTIVSGPGATPMLLQSAHSITLDAGNVLIGQSSLATGIQLRRDDGTIRSSTMVLNFTSAQLLDKVQPLLLQSLGSYVEIYAQSGGLLLSSPVAASQTISSATAPGSLVVNFAQSTLSTTASDLTLDVSGQVIVAGNQSMVFGSPVMSDSLYVVGSTFRKLIGGATLTIDFMFNHLWAISNPLTIESNAAYVELIGGNGVHLGGASQFLCDSSNIMRLDLLNRQLITDSGPLYIQAGLLLDVKTGPSGLIIEPIDPTVVQTIMIGSAQTEVQILRPPTTNGLSGQMTYLRGQDACQNCGSGGTVHVEGGLASSPNASARAGDIQIVGGEGQGVAEGGYIFLTSGFGAAMGRTKVETKNMQVYLRGQAGRPITFEVHTDPIEGEYVNIGNTDYQFPFNDVLVTNNIHSRSTTQLHEAGLLFSIYTEAPLWYPAQTTIEIGHPTSVNYTQLLRMRAAVTQMADLNQNIGLVMDTVSLNMSRSDKINVVSENNILLSAANLVEVSTAALVVHGNPAVASALSSYHLFEVLLNSSGISGTGSGGLGSGDRITVGNADYSYAFSDAYMTNSIHLRSNYQLLEAGYQFSLYTESPPAGSTTTLIQLGHPTSSNYTDLLRLRAAVTTLSDQNQNVGLEMDSISLNISRSDKVNLASQNNILLSATNLVEVVTSGLVLHGTGYTYNLLEGFTDDTHPGGGDQVNIGNTDVSYSPLMTAYTNAVSVRAQTVKVTAGTDLHLFTEQSAGSASTLVEVGDNSIAGNTYPLNAKIRAGTITLNDASLTSSLVIDATSATLYRSTTIYLKTDTAVVTAASTISIGLTETDSGSNTATGTVNVRAETINLYAGATASGSGTQITLTRSTDMTIALPTGTTLQIQNGNLNVQSPYKVQENGYALVPANSVIMFYGAACPNGYTEVTEAQGRAVFGMPSGTTGTSVNQNAATALSVVTDTSSTRYRFSVSPVSVPQDTIPITTTFTPSTDSACNSGNGCYTSPFLTGGSSTSTQEAFNLPSFNTDYSTIDNILPVVFLRLCKKT